MRLPASSTVRSSSRVTTQPSYNDLLDYLLVHNRGKWDVCQQNYKEVEVYLQHSAKNVEVYLQFFFKKTLSILRHFAWQLHESGTTTWLSDGIIPIFGTRNDGIIPIFGTRNHGIIPIPASETEEKALWHGGINSVFSTFAHI